MNTQYSYNNLVLIFYPFFFLFVCCIQDGQRGHLEGLASVYCEVLMAPFGDVLNALENARQAAWAERSPQNRSGGVCSNRGHRGSLQQGGLPNSHSQPIYVPGKYSVSNFYFQMYVCVCVCVYSYA